MSKDLVMCDSFLSPSSGDKREVGQYFDEMDGYSRQARGTLHASKEGRNCTCAEDVSQKVPHRRVLLLLSFWGCSYI